MLSLAIGIAALTYLWAAAHEHRLVVYILKPGTMLLIIALAVGGLRSGAAGAYAGWVAAALALSVAGDVFLMLPKNRFVQGLAAFLAAHLLYIGAVWFALPARLVPGDLLTGAAMAVFAVLMARRLSAALRELGQAGLVAPVIAYIAVISLMVWRSVSLLFQPGPLPVPGWPVALGAVLFCISDSLLGWDRFVRPLPGRHVLVMSTYFAAQYCLALSCTLAA
ncbi:MAG TPA: lysoplasmalogenase [Symbiobacteriaceae bacterium]|nr:lysoplasmalogenase [Symbiobacteriaceae bacterium]